MILVCQVSYEHNHSHKVKLEDLSRQEILSSELEENTAFRLSLVSSKMICNSLYGQLKETEDGNIRQYEASFIARASD